MLDERRYDIDALRSIALFLLIFYHLAVSFTSVAKWILFVPNNKPIDNLWGLLNIFNIWRIPLLFIIAGIALRFSFQNRGISDLFKERLKRLGIPYLFGSITFVPLYLIISAQFIYGEINMDDSVGIVITSFFTGGYLWFLIKVVSLLFVFLWVRATLPRYRYDQLMTLGWKLFLPLSLLWIIITSSFIFFVEYV